MIRILLGLLIGVFIGWSVPQPKSAKLLQKWALEQIAREFSPDRPALPQAPSVPEQGRPSASR